MASHQRKAIENILEEARHSGWEIVYNSKHYKLYPKDKTKPVIILAATPGNARGLKNVLSILKKSGLNTNNI